MDSLMDNCSPNMSESLYEFKYLIRKSGVNVGTFNICVRASDEDGAKRRAKNMLTGDIGDKSTNAICARWGNKIDIVFGMCRKVED